MRTFSIFLFVGFIFSAGCKKDSNDSGAYTNVTYTITDGDNLITRIEYRDANGEVKVLGNYADFGGEEKTIKVKDKPFEAVLKIIVNNTGASQESYVLAISVEGEVKNFKGLLVPQITSGYEGEIKFVVQ